MSELVRHLAYLNGRPGTKGVIRTTPEDFRVYESLSFIPSGEGEHLMLHLEKIGSNTEWVAKQLAKHFDVKPMAVSWAGLKDRHAVTQQWFSVHLPGVVNPDLDFEADNFRLIERSHNNKKLRQGAIENNRFEIVVRSFEGDKAELEARIDKVKEVGVPNYFGEQRFGQDDANFHRAMKWLLEGGRINRTQRPMAISAARSALFNKVVSARIEQGLWNKLLLGDVLMLAKSKSVFTAEQAEFTELQKRLSLGECHITAPLPGDSEKLVQAKAALWEKQVIPEWEEEWQQAFRANRVSAARRACRLMPENLQFEWITDDALKLSFALRTGSYATAVLRELFDYQVADAQI